MPGNGYRSWVGVAVGCMITGLAAAQGRGAPPVAAFTWDPFNPPYYTDIIFDGSASTDADGRIVRFLWDFGEGITAEGEVVHHIYGQNGNFTIRLTVVDDTGLSNTRRVDLPVTDTYR